MKKIMVISTSLRPGSNSDLLAEAFAEGAEKAGHEVTKVSLSGKKLAFCTGCLVCQKTLRCVIHDDADAIVQKMKDADVLAFATPIYYYEMSGQMKTLLDRANPLFPSDYSFRDVYLLASAAEGEDNAIDSAIHGLEGWIRCFEKCRLAGVVRGVGVTDPGQIRDKPEILEQARRLGNSI